MTKAHANEADLAKQVVAWLGGDGVALPYKCDAIYQEVSLGYGRARADIVTSRGPVIHVIETKLTLSIALIEQGMSWQGSAHMVTLAIPKRKAPRFQSSSDSGRGLIRRLGLGLLEVDASGQVTVRERSAFVRSVSSDEIRKCLTEERKTYADAGNDRGDYWSPWQQTCIVAADWVEKHPGCTLKELFANIEHHYMTEASARGAFCTYVQRGKIDGVRCERDGRTMRLYPEVSQRSIAQQAARERMLLLSQQRRDRRK